MIKDGMIVGERYEVISKIGTGGMADVYRAKDHKLNRYVAMKVLKREFSEDTNFIRKFKREAQSAAGLTHPNVVNVFDVGEDQGIHYIVMELVEGITLKEYISKKGKLSVKEATSIAIQVSMGLEAAHNHGVVHRDVKPQNIIISTDGKVKVTDFGIARAASSNTISSNVMGSVHYSSPEQVRGGYSDEKSDIYSLGITMYEMVTGVVPFEGDTTVAIAIKHLQEEMEPPSDYTPDLPFSLEQIIFKCTQKSVDRRYPNMEEVIDDLKHSLVEPDGDFVKLTPLNTEGKTMVIQGEDLNEIKKNNAVKEIPPLPDEEDYYGSEEGMDREDGLEDEDEEDGDGGINRRLEKALTIGGFIVGALILVVLVALIGNAAGLFSFGSSSGKSKDKEAKVTETPETDMVEVPDLVGKTEEEATQTVKELSLGLQYTEEVSSDEYAKGLICSQEIAAGTQVQKYTTIKYKLSSGPAILTLPDVVGQSQDTAEQTLKDMGLNVSFTKSYSYDYEMGTVMSMSPAAGTQCLSSETVMLEVSMGNEYEDAVVPNVIGMEETAAKAALAAFNVNVGYSASDTTEEGLVMSQSAAEGIYVEKGSTIDITVSSGPESASTESPTPGESEEEEGDEEDEEEEAGADTTGTAAQEEDASGTWKCTQTLDTPATYTGGVVKMELVQTVDNSPVVETIMEGKTIDFPYQLDITGEPGVAEGTLYLYELSGSDYVELGHYPITFQNVD